MSSQALAQLPTRHDRRKQETRDRIREAAVGLFAEQGYEQTTIAQICERADVARQTFFNHFPAKTDVLSDTFRIGLDFTWEVMEAACARGASTRERLTHYFVDSIEAAVSVGPFGRELIAQILKANYDAVTVEQRQRVSGVFLAIVRRGLELGDVTRRHEPEVLAELCGGALMALVTDWGAGEAFDPPTRARQLAALAADAIEKRPDED